MPRLEYDFHEMLTVEYATWDEAIQAAITKAREHTSGFVYVVGDDGERIEIRREWIRLGKS